MNYWVLDKNRWLIVRDDNTYELHDTFGDNKFREFIENIGVLNIKDLQFNHFIIALKKDGTCASYAPANINKNADGYKSTIGDVSTWKNIKQIISHWWYTWGLKNDGTIVTTATYYSYSYGTSYKNWSNIIQIAGGAQCICGLRSDGKILVNALSPEHNTSFVSTVQSLTNVKAIYGNEARLLYVVFNDNSTKRYCNRTSNNVDLYSTRLDDWINTLGDISGYIASTMILANNNTRIIIPTGNSTAFKTQIIDLDEPVYSIDSFESAIYNKKISNAFIRGDGILCSIAYDTTSATYNLFEYGYILDKYKKLYINKVPINLSNSTKVAKLNFKGVQPQNTDRKIAFKVDDVWNKIDTDGTLIPLSTQDITVDSIINEGNNVSELSTLTDIPSLAGKLVYPAMVLVSPHNATILPTIGLSVEYSTTVDVYAKTDYSQEFVLHNKRDVLVKSISVDSNTEGNGKVTLKARYATFDETAITEESAEQTEKWSDYVDLLSIINVKCHKLQIRADYQVSITDGSDSATLNDVIITYAKDVVAKADGTTDLVTLTEKFTNDLTYVHAYIKHAPLIDADLKAYVRLQKTPKKADFKLIGYGTGARKTYKVTDKGINQDSLMVYVNGKAVYDFDFNTETSEITLVADVDVPINASYEFGWELFNYVEMQKGVSQVNDSGAYTTEYAYTIPAHDGEYTVTAIKYELIRPEGHVDNEVIGVGTGKRQIIQLPHYARKETIQCNGKWSYDYDSKQLTVIAPEGDNIVISYDWIAESPQVYGVMAGWAD